MTGRYYVGSTQDVEKRLEKHNSGGTRSTKSGLPWQLVYTEEYASRSDVVLREKEIKNKKSRKYIIFLLEKVASSIQRQRHHGKRSEPVVTTVISFKNEG